MYGQNHVQNNLFASQIYVQDCKFTISDQYILNSSIVLLDRNNKVIDSNKYSFKDNEITITNCIDSFYILKYRFLRINHPLKYSLIDSTQLKKVVKDVAIGYDLTPDFIYKKEALIDSKSLDYNGSFSRGFSVGNAQSLVPNSKFDIQLNGELAEGIKINAAISDENIPIQAEGNTQVLQEFDRVFINLSKNRTQVMAGDYVLPKPNSYFMNYFKKLKGLGAYTEIKQGNNEIKTGVNVANSRGKFARQTLANKEGNQGPYKLTGNNNERFIIVLSGTEKIYFNGELLKRGQEYDYVIDYNLAEIIFSPNRLIARETRIIMEFEYTDINYYRTLYTINTNYIKKNTDINFNFYSEQDSKKSPSQIDLDSTAISILEKSGDESSMYGIPSTRQLNNDDVNNVRYEQVENPNFPTDNIKYFLVFNTDINKAQYTASFSEVGKNKGSYQIDQSQSLNGRVYKFVGKNNGNYEPILQLIPPEKKQMMNLSIAQKIGKHHQLYGDFSSSHFDKNTFSLNGNDDDNGLAAYLKIEGSPILSKNKKDSTTLYYNVSVENANKNFKPLNQYRKAEFIRDWNYKPSDKGELENIMRTQVGIVRNKNKILFGFNELKVGRIYKGQNFNIDFLLYHKGLELKGSPSLTTTSEQRLSSNFLRPNFVLSQLLGKKIKVGVELESETNKITDQIFLKLDSTSYSFYLVKNFIEYAREENINYRLSYNKRNDLFSFANELTKAINIDEIEFNARLQASKTSSFNSSLKVRNFQVERNDLVKNEKSKLTILGSIDHSMSIIKKALTSTTSYQINSGQESKLEYVFQKVENLRGDYIYVGSDSATVKNINDFRFDPSNPLASYVRFLIPNNEFTTTNNIFLNHSLRIEPSKYYARDTIRLSKIKSFINRISNLTTLRLANKTMSDSESFNVFDFDTRDSSLVSYIKNISSSFFFNRGNPKYDLTYTIRDNGNKNNQINGFESRTLKESDLKVRLNYKKNTDFNFSYIFGNKSFANKLFTNRNFIIDIAKYNAEISHRYGTKMRINFKYSYITNFQTINDKESALKNDFTLTVNRRSSNLSSIDGSISFVKIKYTGKIGSLIEYDLLEGLRDGSNYLWNINFTRRLNQLIDLTVSYEGRKTGNNNTIYVGRIQAKATF